MRIVHARPAGVPVLKVYHLPGPIARLHSWYRRRFCLQDRLTSMAVLRTGIACDCVHAQLQCGFLDGAGFWAGNGDDICCADCGQVWVATLDSDYYRQCGTDAQKHERESS